MMNKRLNDLLNILGVELIVSHSMTTGDIIE